MKQIFLAFIDSPSRTRDYYLGPKLTELIPSKKYPTHLGIVNLMVSTKRQRLE